MEFDYGLRVKLVGIIRLIRPVNSLMMGFAVMVGEILASKGMIGFMESSLGFSVAFLLTGGTMAINDYYDLKIDIVNEPRRPIPSGQVTSGESLFIGLAFAFLGVFLSIFTGTATLLIASTAAVLMIYYNTAGKKTGFWGNIIVSICVSLPFIYGGVVVGGSIIGLLLFSIMAFLSNVGREVVKGIVDLEGDRRIGIKTVALRYGIRKAAFLSTVFFVSAVFFSFFPIILKIVSFPYIPLIIITDLGFIWSSFSVIVNPTPENAKKVKNFTLIWMFMGLIAFLIGSIST